MRNNIFLVLISLCSFTSCSTMYNLRTINLEMISPGLLPLEKIDTIAIFNRNFNDTVNKAFSYKDVANDTIVRDSLLTYNDISNACLDALTNFLDSSGYFFKVINYRDSLNAPVSVNDMLIQLEEIKRMNVDACIFLDYLDLNDKLMTHNYYFNKSVILSFPEFAKSTIMESIKVKMIWSILLSGDSAYSTIPMPDNLYYGNSTHPNFFGSDQNHRMLIENTANYIADSFAKTLIPSWNPSERYYYRSHNPQMLLAEKYLLKGEYINAAEIYSKFTNNKNPNIVAKATYNMAFINEMEGNMDAALDWLYRSNSDYKHGNTLHQFNCKEYGDMLRKRMLETEVLDKQVRNYENNVWY